MYYRKGHLRREEEFTREDLLNEMEENAPRPPKPGEISAEEVARDQLTAAEEEEYGEAAWLYREGGLDLKTALGALRLHIRSDRRYARALETLLLYASNVLEHPQTEAFRIVRSSNTLFSSRLGGFKGGLRCMYSLGFRPVSFVGEQGPAMDALDDSYLAMFQVPKDLARHRVSLEQAFLKVAGSKGYSVITLREHEALSACRANSSQKLAYLQSLVALEAARGPPLPSSALKKKRSTEEIVTDPQALTPIPRGDGGGGGWGGGAGLQMGGISLGMYKAMLSARLLDRQMAPPFSADIGNATNVTGEGGEEVGGGVDDLKGPGRVRYLEAYLKELFPAWEIQLCDAAANALLPLVDNVGIGIEVSVTRPDEAHPDKRVVEITRVLNKGPADLCGVKAGDRIVSIDGCELAGVVKSGPLADAVSKVTTRIRGSAGTNVTLTLTRAPGGIQVQVGGGVARKGEGGGNVMVSIMRGQKYECPRAAPVILIACISSERCREVSICSGCLTDLRHTMCITCV